MHLEVYDASGHLVRDLGSVQSTAGPSALLLSQSMLYADGTAEVLLYDGAGGWTKAWDGTAPDGNFVPAGVYLVRSTYTAYSDGSVAVKQAALSVAPVGDRLGASLIAVPNPADGSRPMELRWIPTARAALVQARVYNIAAELVYLKDVAASKASLPWDLNTPNGFPVTDGVYLWDVIVRDDHNRVIERQVRKVVILRHK